LRHIINSGTKIFLKYLFGVSIDPQHSIHTHKPYFSQLRPTKSPQRFFLRPPPRGIRTPDPWYWRPSLYPQGYRALPTYNWKKLLFKPQTVKSAINCFRSCSFRLEKLNVMFIIKHIWRLFTSLEQKKSANLKQQFAIHQRYEYSAKGWRTKESLCLYPPKSSHFQLFSKNIYLTPATIEQCLQVVQCTFTFWDVLAVQVGFFTEEPCTWTNNNILAHNIISAF